jgi:FkbM family methyltransferase
VLLETFLAQSTSQIGQETFVAHKTNFKKNGYFVEFGATNGVDINNTQYLEKLLGWQGILAEPATCWHEQLHTNRPNCMIDHDCVWSKTGETLLFNEVESGQAGYSNSAELSTIAQYSECDVHAAARTTGKSYTVQTISLVDLLRKHSAPKNIDYLSIDTEGSELEILSAFDFDEYVFDIITCEHVYKDTQRTAIYNLLTSKGYVRVDVAHSHWEDWYVREGCTTLNPNSAEKYILHEIY